MAKKKIAPRTRGEVLPQLKNERATRCEYIVPLGSENDKEDKSRLDGTWFGDGNALRSRAFREAEKLVRI